MKKVITIIMVIAVLGIGLFAGLKFYANLKRPALNGNEKIVSNSIDKNGKPINIIGDVNNIKIKKNQGEVYLSIPVNDKNMTDCHVILKYKGKVINDTTVKVSKARYVTYHVTDLKNMEPGLYQFAFYDGDGKINVYAGLIVQ